MRTTLDQSIRTLARTNTLPDRGGSRRALLKRLKLHRITVLTRGVQPASEALLRREVFSRISQPKTIEVFHGVRSVLEPSLALILILRKEVLDRIANWEPATSLHSRLRWVTVTAVLAIFIRITPTFFIAPPLQAEIQHLLIPGDGFVSITQGAEWSRVFNPLDLTAALTIRTEGDSTATVILGDAAVLRLGENTEVNVRDLAFVPPQDHAGPIARATYGQVWLTSLLPETLNTEITVVLPQGLLALKQGSVSVLADPQQSTVQVFHRFAEVQQSTGERIHLIEGDQLTLLPEELTQRHLITETMRQEIWVQENMTKDAVHRTEFAEKNQELATTLAGILPTSTFYSLKRASEQIDLWLTISHEARTEKKLRHAETRLNEAVALLRQGEGEAAESSLAEYSSAIRAFASLSEEEAMNLLTPSLIASTTTVAAAFPHSDLYPAKKTVLETSSDVGATSLSREELDFYLLNDALLGMEDLIVNGDIAKAAVVFDGVEGAVASVLEWEELAETKVGKENLKVLKTVLRAIASSLEQTQEISTGNDASIASLLKRVEGKFPVMAPPTLAQSTEASEVCMTVREVTRAVNRFLSSVYIYQTPRAQRNEVLRQISLLPDCEQSGRVLAKVMNKVPVFTRSFVWEALQKVDAAT